jgi:nitrite reductase/ring-hydroxylating ferredoxin subunit
MDQHRAPGSGSGCARRRVLLAGLAGGALTAIAAGCSAPATPTLDPRAGAGAEQDAGRPVLARTADVPVGGGVIVGNVVLVQPTPGTFRAFSAVCPHRGARVSAPVDGVATCWEHNSTFSAADGSRLSGPATRGLAEMPITVDGPDIHAT